jgi:hypothetical protein
VACLGISDVDEKKRVVGMEAVSYNRIDHACSVYHMTNAMRYLIRLFIYDHRSIAHSQR